MTSEEGELLIAGILIGVFLTIVVAIIINTAITDRIKNVDDWTMPDNVYKVTIDGASFTCNAKPTFKQSKIFLYGCQELFGHATVIKSYSTLTFEIVK